MKITDVFSAKAVALHQTEVASNRIPYLGEGLFPSQQKMGLELKSLRTHKGLPISLAPTNFDAKSTLRPRKGFSFNSQEMAFFRESMLVSEKDEQDMMRVQDSADPYATEILTHIYDDVDELVEGARVVPERMRMQLLAPDVDGSPRININHDGVQYSYNYDPDGSYASHNYLALTGNNAWDNANSDPIKNVQTAQDAIEAATGVRPTILLMNSSVMTILRQNAAVRSAILAQNTTANIFVTDATVANIFATLLGVTIVVYNKQYKDEAGTAHKFYPDKFVTLLPDGALGKTWFGVTPEQRALMGKAGADVSVLDNGIAVSVTTTSDPVNTKTTISEICLPTYERMDETYVLKVDE